MANYNVDIAVAIKGNEKLTRFKNTTSKLSLEIKQLNKFLKVFQLGGDGAVRSFNSLNSVLATAKANFNAVASGTKLQEKAARQLIIAEKELNAELRQRESLLQRLSTAPLPLPGTGRGRDPVESSRRRKQKRLDQTLRGQSVPLTSPIFPGYSQPIGPQPMQGPSPMQGPLQMMTVNNNPRILRNIAASQAARQDTNFGFGLAGDPVAKSIRRNQQKREKLLQKELKIRQNILQVEKLSLDVASAEKSTKAFGVSGGQIGPALPRGFRLKQQFAEGGMFAATKGQRVRGALSSGLIGGGFPLLFGQGGLGALGGGVGGLAGGALGGGFGFGLSIVGTAIAQQIQQTLDFRKSITELNKEMEQMGISSNISGSQVRQLGKSLGITKEEAVKALQEFKRFGDNAVLFAEKFGGDFAKFDAIAQANTVQSALAAIRKINKDITLDDELRFLNSVRRQGVEATINQMLDEMLEKEKKLETAGFGQGEGKNAGANRKRLGQLRQESKATQDLTDKNRVFREELIKVRDQFIQNRDAAEAANRSIASGLEQINAEIRKLNDAQFQVVELSKTLGSAFSESFKGIIKGTMSVADAFRSMFMRIADHFLDMAAQMMAAQISRGFLGLFGNAFSSFSFAGSASAYPNAFDTSFDMGLLGFANGGRPPVGRPSIVGEKGPELFVPNTAGTIIPNHAMGGMNIVVNVDASGTNVEGDEEQGRELGRLISVAVQSEILQQKRPGGLLA